MGGSKMEDNVMKEVTHDALTGLRDWGAFFQDVKKSVTMSRRSHIVFVQLLQLKRINRKYNIHVGDRLLGEVADYLDKLDTNYTAYRTNNSRFMLMGPECSREEADGMLVRIRSRFQENWEIAYEGQKYDVQAKACLIHFFLEPMDTELDLLDKMNHAVSVFRAKERKGILFFNEELNADMLRKRYILNEVRYAVEHKTFQAFYQPIYDCNEKRFVSAESLIRLYGRDGTFLSPGEFIPMAEENGLIDGISWIMLEKVCAFLGEHPDLPIDAISVNMTGQQILDATFTRRIEENLEKYGVEGSRLRIEITERTITDDFAEVRKVMEYLSEKGIQFYLDDFGTGYSNLSSMLSLPFEVIKFDQSLIRMMDGTDKGQRTIGLLADIMHENDYSIVAEGIETAGQVQNAFERNLDRIQGYYYARPMPGEELAEFLAKYPGVEKTRENMSEDA